VKIRKTLKIEEKGSGATIHTEEWHLPLQEAIRELLETRTIGRPLTLGMDRLDTYRAPAPQIQQTLLEGKTVASDFQVLPGIQICVMYTKE
jgi:hypothetical protein